MKINETGLDLIKSFEGTRLAPYKCSAGIPTIGVGATFYQDGRKVAMTDPPITEVQATALLQFHLQKFEKDVLGLVKVPLGPNQFAALVSFAFNCGTGSLSISTLLKKLNVLDYPGAANEFLQWDKAKVNKKTVVVPGLTRRRKAEKELFLKPETASPAKSANSSALSDGPSESDIDSILKKLETGI